RIERHSLLVVGERLVEHVARPVPLAAPRVGPEQVFVAARVLFDDARTAGQHLVDRGRDAVVPVVGAGGRYDCGHQPSRQTGNQVPSSQLHDRPLTLEACAETMDQIASGKPDSSILNGYADASNPPSGFTAALSGNTCDASTSSPTRRWSLRMPLN